MNPFNPHKFMVLEWWTKSDGGEWHIIGFFDNLEEVEAIKPSRPKKVHGYPVKTMVLSVQKISGWDNCKDD